MATAKKASTATSKATTKAKKTTSKAKSTSKAKKTTTSAKKATSTAAKKTTTGSSVKVTATEKKLLELYRAADADTKKAAIALLKGEKTQVGGILESILENKTIMNTVANLFK